LLPEYNGNMFDRFANLLNVSQLRNPNILFSAMALVVLVIYGLSVGKTKALVSLLAIYVAYMLTALFPFIDLVQKNLPEQLSLAAPALLFITMYLGVFLLLNHSLRRTRLTLGELSVSHVLLISVVQVGLLAAIGASLLPPDQINIWLGSLAPYFSNPLALFAWAAGSLLVLPLMKRRHEE
jgi:hypothetical protein